MIRFSHDLEFDLQFFAGDVDSTSDSTGGDGAAGQPDDSGGGKNPAGTGAGSGTEKGAKSGENTQSLLKGPQSGETGNEAPAASGDAAGREGAKPGEETQGDPDGGEKSKDGKEDDDKDLTGADFTLPEGYQWEPESGKPFLDLLNDPKITRRELGQKLIDHYAARQKTAREWELARIEKQNADWLDECRKDPEIGGVNFETNKAVIARGAARFPEALEVLEDVGLGTCPAIVKMFWSIEKQLGEGRLVAGRTKTAPLGPAEAIFGESVRRLETGE
jgi:hypothetical protein